MPAASTNPSPHRRSPSPSSSLRGACALWLALFASTACVGEITESPSSAGAGGPGTVTPTGAPLDPTAPPPPATSGPTVVVGNVAIDPGRVVAHRLNRVEYDNTTRDLFFGLPLKAAAAFPIDNFAEGFDNNAQELGMSNLLMEKYLDAADALVKAAFADATVRAKLVPCRLDATDAAANEACAQKSLATFLERAYRRPVAADDLAPYQKLMNTARGDGDRADVQLQLAMRAALVSPGFLYRVEPDPPQGKTRALGDFEIAARLSYFLWSSMPDDELMRQARAGALQKPDEVTRQVKRMLADGRAAALVDNLAGQWLYARQIPELTPDTTLFPGFDAGLRDAIRTEMTMFLREILLGGGSALTLLKANFTFANRRLAEHYGLPEARTLGTDFVRVPLTTDRRGGLLTQAGWLTVTSHPDSTSPVKRGKWILSELLCIEPPPPPPNVGDLTRVPQTGSLRERFSAHTNDPTCAGCHSLLDPLGFGLENYDAIGRWRDRDSGAAIDATGTMPGSNERFATPAELATAVQKDSRFARCLTRKLLTYAVGRGMGSADAPAIDALTERFARGGHRFTELIELVAQSPLMTMRGGSSQP
ncbi:MAG TPA: DUF1592 domain-containing protein [Polyangia bacterium]